jgi:hypothetical protein
MNNILLIHNTKLSSAEYKSAIKKRYPHLDGSIWKLQVNKLGNKIPTKKYDRLYYDSDTITIAEITKYVASLPNFVDVIGISLSEQKKGFNLNIRSNIKKMREG